MIHYQKIFFKIMICSWKTTFFHKNMIFHKSIMILHVLKYKSIFLLQALFKKTEMFRDWSEKLWFFMQNHDFFYKNQFFVPRIIVHSLKTMIFHPKSMKNYDSLNEKSFSIFQKHKFWIKDNDFLWKIRFSDDSWKIMTFLKQLLRPKKLAVLTCETEQSKQPWPDRMREGLMIRDPFGAERV